MQNVKEMIVSSKGFWLAMLTALVSGVAVFVNKFGVSLWNNSSIYTTAKNIIAAIFLTAFILALKKFKEIKNISKKDWAKLILIGFIGGSIPFLLFFKSLEMISAPEAAIIHKTLFLWVAGFSFLFLKEKLNSFQFAALGILVLTLILSGLPKSWSFGYGSLLALCATLLWAAESIIAKKVLENISPTVLGWSRMFFGSIFLIGYLVLTQNVGKIIPTSFEQILVSVAISAILFAYVVSWYSALKNAPVTIVTSVLVIAAPITTLLDSVILKHTISLKTLIITVVMLFAIIIITKKFEKLLPKSITNRLAERA